SILGGPRPLSSDRRAQPDYTLSCEEPVKPSAIDFRSNELAVRLFDEVSIKLWVRAVTWTSCSMFASSAFCWPLAASASSPS
ncbi:hypothetical protein EZE58_01025, partial [Brevibacterium sp. LS14]|nr:hypothetical protein [Brevibacterium sp. LS14]